MKMTLHVYAQIGAPPDSESIPNVRQRMLNNVANQFRRLEPTYSDGALVFRGIEPEERAMIIEACRTLGENVSFAAFPQYSHEEISAARFVPLLIKHDEVDCDKDGAGLNEYPVRLCCTCWSYDLTVVPNPFHIIRPRRPGEIFNASNGVRIVSASLWRQLRDVLEPWVRTGPVEYASSSDQPTNELLWFMPRQMIGSYINTMVVKRCPSCNLAVEVRRSVSHDPLLRNMDVVTHIPMTDAPIALVGSWHGSFRPGKRGSTSWDIVISGQLHDRLWAMKPKGFSRADRVVHTRDEMPLLGLAVSGKEGQGDSDDRNPSTSE